MNSSFLETAVFTLLVGFSMASLRSNVKIKGTTVRPGLVVRKGVCKYKMLGNEHFLIIFLTQKKSQRPNVMLPSFSILGVAHNFIQRLYKGNRYFKIP